MKKQIVTLIILIGLCFPSVCPAPDIWMDVDAALSEVPVNIYPLTDSAGTIDTGVTYDEAGISLVWNFCTSAGAFSSTAVTPTTSGTHDWAEHTADKGMYTIEIPASGGTISNNTEGTGWFTGNCTATLPWRGPTIGFRAVVMNNLMIDVGTSTVGAIWTDPITNADIEAEAVDALESFDLDHLLSVTTGVAADADLESYVSSGTVMAHLMGIGADVTTFNATEDSVEALGTHADAAATAAKLLAYIQLLIRDDGFVYTDNSTELGEINANTGTGVGTYDNRAEAVKWQSAYILTIESQTDDIGVAGVGLTAIGTIIDSILEYVKALR